MLRAVRPICAAWILAAVWAVAGAAAQPLVAHGRAADFDGSGGVDLADLDLLRQAMGSADARFDLDGDGRVDVADLFRFAEAFDGAPPAAAGAAALTYSVRTSRQDLVLALPAYVARLRHAAPFGIGSLRLRGQATDFAHASLPLADWEWLWFHSPAHGTQRHKLLERDWSDFDVRALPDRAEAVSRTALTRDGVEAEVRFVFPAEGTSFHVDYTVVNGSGRDLDGVYLMLGLPGFSDPGQVVEVASAGQRRLPLWPFSTFLGEITARQVAEYLLLRQDARHDRSAGLKGSVRLRDGGGDYTLSSYCLVGPDVEAAYSAHTDKPRYLTSHVYVTLGHMQRRSRRTVTIHHVLDGP